MGGSSNWSGGGGPTAGKLLEILNVRVVGNPDRPALVLSHGFGTDQSAWNRVVPYFQRDYRIVLYDLVCAGSVNPDHFDFLRYTTLDAYVDDLLAILDALRVDRCFFVGHSVSAMIAILAAIRRPDAFLKLILIGASPRKASSWVLLLMKVFERQGLPRGIREGGDREVVRGDGVELRGVGPGVRAAGGGGGRAGGGEGVQPDAVQHAAGHLLVRGEDGVQQRPAWCAGAGAGALRRRPDGQGRVRAALRRRLPQGPPRRPDHRRDPQHRGPPPPPQRPRRLRHRPPPLPLPVTAADGRTPLGPATNHGDHHLVDHEVPRCCSADDTWRTRCGAHRLCRINYLRAYPTWRSCHVALSRSLFSFSFFFLGSWGAGACAYLFLNQ